MDRAQAILDFWFAGDTKFWFSKNETTDNTIKEQFLDDLNKAIHHEYTHWARTPKGRLALIILLDQFSRNIYRNSEHAYLQDEMALQLSLDGIKKQMDQKLTDIERVFFYMPLQHAENLEVQEQSVQLFETLYRNNDDLKGFFQYARKHQDIIKRFGRFPHRNNILNRESTEEELEFLTQPGSSF